ncbi:MAG: alpha/beta hydrolase family protein [Bacteroidia bacterium]
MKPLSETELNTLHTRDGFAMPATFALPESAEPAPLIVFVHGFKGFKDWGHFPLLSRKLCEAGFAVLRFNFSHNGTSPGQPSEFVNLEAFGRNTYSRELNDLSDILDQLEVLPNANQLNFQKIALWGHSRGGAIATLKTAEDNRIKALVTWAGVADLPGRILNSNQERWRKNGVQFTHNARTAQDMPMYVDLLDDTLQHTARFDAAAAATRITVPHLIIHGTADAAVPVAEAELLHQKNPKSELLMIENADHTFGGKHPFAADDLPNHSLHALKKMTEFLQHVFVV